MQMTCPAIETLAPVRTPSSALWFLRLIDSCVTTISRVVTCGGELCVGVKLVGWVCGWSKRRRWGWVGGRVQANTASHALRPQFERAWLLPDLPACMLSHRLRPPAVQTVWWVQPQNSRQRGPQLGCAGVGAGLTITRESRRTLAQPGAVAATVVTTTTTSVMA